tara:strand:- start:300 stop:467 length:168 start_codon:yes stop_codon:yes gene_type:complete
MKEEIEEKPNKLKQIRFRFEFMSLMSAAGRHDEMNESFQIAQELVNQLIEEEELA